jgi:hypothetical protein
MLKRDSAKTGSRRILDECGVEVVRLTATYRSPGTRALIMDGFQPCSVEEYACHYFKRLGYSPPPSCAVPTRSG